MDVIERVFEIANAHTGRIEFVALQPHESGFLVYLRVVCEDCEAGKTFAFSVENLNETVSEVNESAALIFGAMKTDPQTKAKGN